MPGDITAIFKTDLTISDFPLQYPKTVQFTDQSLGNPVGWFWDFGDDTYSESQNPLHIYNEEPTGPVKFYAWKSRQGSSSTFSGTVDGGVKDHPIIFPQPDPPWVWWCDNACINPEVWPFVQAKPWNSATKILVAKYATWNITGYHVLGFGYSQQRLDLTTKEDAFLTYLKGSNAPSGFVLNDPDGDGCAPTTKIGTQNILMSTDDTNRFEKKLNVKKIFKTAGDDAILGEIPTGGNRIYTFRDFDGYKRYKVGDDIADITVCEPPTEGASRTIGYQVRPDLMIVNAVVSDHWDSTTKGLTKSVDFVGVPRSGASPLSVQFTDLSIIDVQSWSWNFGDGPVLGTTQHPLHVYTVGLTN